MKNNDRFKFRVAYYKKYDNMFYGFEYTDFEKGVKQYNPNIEYHSEYEQCTGLKDKYGKLIYEGDIVNILPEEELAVISWDSDSAYVVFKTEDVCYSFDNFFSYELEVIGNIHENPELLQ